MNNELNDELLLLAPKEEVDLEEYLQLEIYLTYPKEDEELPLLRRSFAITEAHKDPVREFINREFRELNFSSRHIYGSWNGMQEVSTIVTHLVLTSEAFPIYNRFKEIAQKYKEEFNQECVLLTVTPIKAKFV